MRTLTRPQRPLIEWAPQSGRELGSERIPETPPAPWRVVACLNVWNDAAALRRTLPTWIDHVDAVIAVDGEYGPCGSTLSTDGTREYLKSLNPKVTVLDAAGLTQCEKRTAYCNWAGNDSVLLVVIDADESIENAKALRSAPMLDVGWVRMASGLYAKPYGQPRLFRWQPGLHYRGRHHWLYCGDDLLATHQYGGPGFEHRTVGVTFTNHRGLGHDRDRHAAKREHGRAQLATEIETAAPEKSAGPHTAKSDAMMRRRESLRIATIALRDDGIAPSRLHTAINRTTPHASLFFSGEPHPFGSETQYLIGPARDKLHAAMRGADIVHIHVRVPPTVAIPQGRVVLHHHGSPLRRHPEEFAKIAAQMNALVLVSNLQLLTHAPDAHFLPNVVPVQRYRRLRDHVRASGAHAGFGDHPGNVRPFRVAHSPSRPAIKGTDSFLRACERLQARGYPIEPVLIQKQTHRESLETKATCDAAFDAFWLGMQCSGLEAAAMGLPVIAGDVSVRDRSIERYGDCPYTFAEDEEQLEVVLHRMIVDPDYRWIEAERVHGHVVEYHDESAVALAYLDLLDDAFHWR
jgi:hypothetical protein